MSYVCSSHVFPPPPAAGAVAPRGTLLNYGGARVYWFLT